MFVVSSTAYGVSQRLLAFAQLALALGAMMAEQARSAPASDD